MNVYNMNGPEFLRIFWLVEIAALGVASCARRVVLNWVEIDPHYARLSAIPEKEEPEETTLDLYDVALLKGGTKHAFLTALQALERSSVAAIDRTKNTVTKLSSLNKSAHPLERVVENATWANATDIFRVFDAVQPQVESWKKRLVGLGLIPGEQQESLARFLPFQILMLPLLFLGVPKIFIGLSLHKPIGFLLISCFVLAFAAVVFITQKPLRTSAGDTKLADLKAESVALEENYRSHPTNLNIKDALLAYALFATAEFHLLNDPQRVNGGGGGCGSSGGGGCGGGCGGCGGCGG